MPENFDCYMLPSSKCEKCYIYLRIYYTERSEYKIYIVEYTTIHSYAVGNNV